MTLFKAPGSFAKWNKVPSQRSCFGGSIDITLPIHHLFHCLSFYQYLIFDCHQRPLACVLIGSAVWSVQCRDNYFGWDTNTRRRNLNLTTNNMRFLIPPWVRLV
ncbi:MAG: DUF4338 domain-containing protein, partial [Desulfobacterales bacterium]